MTTNQLDHLECNQEEGESDMGEDTEDINASDGDDEDIINDEEHDDNDVSDDDDDDEEDLASEEDDEANTDSGDDADQSDADEDETPSNDSKDDNKLQGMAGMADVISKILGKTLPQEKDVVLSKCKQSKKRKTDIKEEFENKKTLREKKSDALELNHVLPTRSNAQNEILLRKIATKGVVKLFNAVSAHQKKLTEKLDDAKTEARKSKAADRITKDSFLDMLTDSTKSKSSYVKNEAVKNEETEKPAWAVLQDNFMMSSRMKDWDKEDGDDGNDAADHPDDSNDDDDDEDDDQ